MTDTDVQRAPVAKAPGQRNWRDYLSPDELDSYERLHALIEKMRETRRSLRKDQEAARSRFDHAKSLEITRRIVTLDRRKRQLMAERDHIRNRGASRKIMWRTRDGSAH